jgi:phenylalanyl-tRNA synthetase beta chain
MPPATRDLACVLADSVSAGAALSALRSAGGALLEEVTLFDVYRGEPVPEGYRSLAFRLRYRAEDRTLDEEEIDLVHDRVRRALVSLGGELRS